ncbi:MAG: ATP-dependent zinc metalloprotease FtsH [Clostridia bacterium]|nr:ATP-dependent zinc metalloprotease FtsH [Clostridia bacterium]
MEQNLNNGTSKKSKLAVIITSIALIAILALAFLVFAGARSGKEIAYTQFISDVSAGSVKSVTFGANKVETEYVSGERFWFYNRGEVDESQLKSYILTYNDAHPTAKIAVYNGTTTTFSIMSLLYPILALGVTIFLIVLVFRKVGSINNKSFDFVKNRARIIPSKTKFGVVAGIDEEKEEVREIIEFLKNPKKFIEIGARIPKGVLLVGAPGTGKTLLAKAIAGEAEVPFFSISGSDFMELFVGVGASRVRDLFENAKKAKPCIVFIDEIDAVGRQRGAGMGGGNDEREQTLNQLLVQMDGFEENEGIIVIAATNRADILDPALLRPGRFDRQIYIHTPDVRGREQILMVHAKNKPLAEDVDLKVVARITSGFTGADLENLLNESAILAAKDNRTKISMQDINNGIVKVTMGPQKKSRIVSDKDRRITAVHESGHAIIEKLVKNSNPVHEISIVPRGGAGGYTLSRPDNDDEYMTRGKLYDRITVLLGGRSAEKLFLEDITTGASNDIERASSLARKMVAEWGMSEAIGNVCMGKETSVFLGRDYTERATYSEKEAGVIDAEIQKIIAKCTKDAETILSAHKDILNNMVEVLLAKETIYSDEVNMLIGGASAQEVIEFIDNKTNSGEKRASQEGLVADGKAEEANKEEDNQPKDKNASTDIDKLLKIAEERQTKMSANLKIDEDDKKIAKPRNKKEDKSEE